jgi:ferrochelatase
MEMAADWANPHIAELLAEQAVSVNPQMAVAHTHDHHSHDHEGGHHHHH